MATPRSEQPEVDPKDFLRALLRITPEDAKAIRERTPEPPQPEGHEGSFDDDEDDSEPS